MFQQTLDISQVSKGACQGPGAVNYISIYRPLGPLPGLSALKRLTVRFPEVFKGGLVTGFVRPARQRGNLKLQALAYRLDGIWLLFSLAVFHYLGGRAHNSDKMMDALRLKESVLPRAVPWKTFTKRGKKQTALKAAAFITNTFARKTEPQSVKIGLR